MSAKTATEEVYVATGRRKAASARVRLSRGSGQITINGKPMDVYLYDEQLVRIATTPVKIAELDGQIDADICVKGGGSIGQAGAIALGVARALQKLNGELRAPLKKAGQLTRDGRVKERKKPGRPGARRRFQFSKR